MTVQETIIRLYFALAWYIIWFFSSFVHIHVVYKVSVEEPGLVIHLTFTSAAVPTSAA
jgi:hypothetical protein